MAPSWAVKPQPTVADRASPATSGAISRVLKYAEMKPVKAETPSWFEGVVALQADLGAGEEGQEGDDADGAADQRQAAGARG